MQRVLAFVPARRQWAGAGRGAPGPAALLDFVAVRADGVLESGTAPLGQLPRARSLELVFDSVDVYSTAIEAPPLGEARMRLALPNLLEERMLGDPTDCHFAWAAHGAPDGAAAQRLSVAAINRTTLTRTLEACTQAQLQPVRAYSELHTLGPPRDGIAALRVAGTRVLLRAGADQGISFDLDEGAAGALALVKAQAGIRQLLVYGGVPPALEGVAAALGLAVVRANAPIDLEATSAAVNLLQGPFAATAGFGATGRWITRVARSGAWRAPVAWAGACAVLALAGLNATWFKLDGQYRDVRESMRHAFRDAFPAEPTIVDEVAQARRLVAGLRARAGRPSAEDFSVLNAQALELLAAAPAGIVAAIDYSDAGFVLRFRPGTMDAPAQRNSLQAQALQQGLELRFDPEGAAHLAPRGG